MVIKILRLLQLCFFWVFFISKYFQIFPFSFFEKKFAKKSMQSSFSRKNDFCCIMLYARFLPNFKSHFIKMDIYPFFKNVQNEKLPTNLDRPFFGDSKFGNLCRLDSIYSSIFVYTY